MSAWGQRRPAGRLVVGVVSPFAATPATDWCLSLHPLRWMLQDRQGGVGQAAGPWTRARGLVGRLMKVVQAGSMNCVYVGADVFSACVILSSITLDRVTDVLEAFDDLTAAKDLTTKSKQLMVTVKGRDMYRWVLNGSPNPEAVRKDIVAMVVVSVILMVFFITTLVLTVVSLVLISRPNLRDRSSCCGSHRACRTFTMDIAVDGVLAVLWLALFIAAAVLDPSYVQNSIGALVMSVLFVATAWLSFTHRSQILSSSPGEKGGAD
eukprot:gene1839-2171_t